MAEFELRPIPLYSGNQDMINRGSEIKAVKFVKSDCFFRSESQIPEIISGLRDTHSHRSPLAFRQIPTSGAIEGQSFRRSAYSPYAKTFGMLSL